MAKQRTINYKCWASGIIALLMTFSIAVPAQDEPPTSADAAVKDTLGTLESLVTLRNDLQQDIRALNKQIDAAQSVEGKKELGQQLEKLRADLRVTTGNFREVAAGVDITALQKEKEEVFDFQAELLALLKPAFDEMKEMSSHVRQKSSLKEKIIYYEERLLIIEQAISNIDQLLLQSESSPLEKVLKSTKANWEQSRSFMQSELQADRLQLDKLLASETSIAEASQSYLKSFFQKRGLYLAEAILVIIAIILLSRLSYLAMERYLSGFRAKHRSFRIRLVELMHRVITILLVVMGPMVVFYLVEDWMLFSLGVLLLIGIALTLRNTLPHHWRQVHLFLNIGSVREGERILLDGLPWKIQRINFFCILVNPVADISQRVPLNDLVDLKSRPYGSGDVWFPCKRGDWVILDDGVRGKVTGISPEMVQLMERGGSRKTYQTGDFLENAPRNLSTNFRIKETLGISYSLQKESTVAIPEVLHRFIQQRAEQEGYSEQLLNLRVEFEQASESSLDLVVIADFEGMLGDAYKRLRRVIQRWCVDACTEYGWEIPFQQLTLHGPVMLQDTP
ncbi:MAG: hypothetical protein GY696_16860 [Gammaproteobacteria bacterium]|nr:hypothetical protein [Gammaproteobacteria bacterium]